MRALIPVLLLLVLASCDTTRLTYIHNNTNHNVQTYVEIDSAYLHGGAYPTLDSLPIWGIANVSENYLAIHKTSEITYTIIIPPKTKALLYPLNLGIPVRNVRIHSNTDTFTCCYYISKKELKHFKKIGKIKSTTNWNLFHNEINYFVNN